MRYIRAVHVDSPGTRNEHISSVKYAFSTSGAVFTATREGVAAEIRAGHTYRTHNDQTGAEAPVIAATSSSGRPYITTVADGRESNNLLGLPRF
ncbi:DUF3892 domain-containing protein [Sanguibacter suarezii]|uniref:DUF3892 domain-containing protein n=1 Tax=Sanguibacter suarezii TaxID=60921 RepID=UPI00082F5AB0|nr:DUF3892 domain-containing protein [Sanguibacter suarezii]